MNGHSKTFFFLKTISLQQDQTASHDRFQRLERLLIFKVLMLKYQTSRRACYIRFLALSSFPKLISYPRNVPITIVAQRVSLRRCLAIKHLPG
ncbi:hypothetical protein ID10_05840 [Pantoea agglomerans]|jgi:hypothetical protein|nr:hypothetical protein ID10_05840 [Pantoea agglomerans]